MGKWSVDWGEDRGVGRGMRHRVERSARGGGGVGWRGDVVKTRGAGTEWERIGRARSGRTGASTCPSAVLDEREWKPPPRGEFSSMCSSGPDPLLSVTGTGAGWSGGFFLKHALLPNCHAKLKGEKEEP